MCEITEKLESMTWRAVKVCTKAGARRSPGHKNACFRANFQSSCFEKEDS
jgi:hypothetical protein